MNLSDRVLRSLFVGLAVALGWGIRGDYGHLLGAMYPGAALGLGFCYVSGQAAMFYWMPVIAAITALGIGAGGHMSYGILHGYAQSDTLLNYGYGFLSLLLQGGAWGGFGCATAGLFLETKRLKVSEWISLVIAVLVSGFIFFHLVYTLIGFDINPPRSNAMTAYTGGIMGLALWLIYKRKTYGLKGLLFGYLGFGLGMAMGRLLGNAFHFLPEGYSINNWNVMETSCGFFGGFTFTFGMLGKKFGPFPAAPGSVSSPGIILGYKIASYLGMIYLLGIIPLFHLLLRMPLEKVIENVTAQQSALGITDVNAFSTSIHQQIQWLCGLGLVGVLVWMFLYTKKMERWVALPVLWLSTVMLLIQNTNCFHFWETNPPGLIDMHNVFWVIYTLMIIIVIGWKRHEVTDPDEVADHANWRAWIAGGIAVYLFILVFASFINGEKSMRTANTRWPLWTWKDGPFPMR